MLINLVFLKENNFNSYCKPVINPKLTKFCTSLTGIGQEKVDESDEFPLVLKKVEKWFEEHELGTKNKFAVATDG
jgi:3'-5' exoribonuclease 1